MVAWSWSRSSMNVGLGGIPNLRDGLPRGHLVYHAPGTGPTTVSCVAAKGGRAEAKRCRHVGAANKQAGRTASMLARGDQPIGLEETDDGIWAIHFNTVLLATFET